MKFLRTSPAVIKPNKVQDYNNDECVQVVCSLWEWLQLRVSESDQIIMKSNDEKQENTICVWLLYDVIK